MKFKVGDKVKCLLPCQGILVKNRIYTVIDVDNNYVNGVSFVDLKGVNNFGNKCNWSGYIFELYKPNKRVRKSKIKHKDFLDALASICNDELSTT